MTSTFARIYRDGSWIRTRHSTAFKLPEAIERRSSSYSVTFLSSAAAIPDELWAMAFPPPCEGRWLYEALERSGLENQFNFLYAYIWKDGAPVGVAPAFVMDVPIMRVTPEKLLKPLQMLARVMPSVLYQRTLFAGSPSSTEGAIGLLPGCNARQAMLALQDALEKKACQAGAELIVWKEMPPRHAAALDWVMKRRRLFRTASLPGTLMSFSSQKKDDYFAQLKGSRRSALKRKLKLGAAEADLSFEMMQQPSQELLDEVYELFRQTYLKSKVKFEELNRAWFTELAELPLTYFAILREKRTGSIVAFMMCFACGQRLINKHVGFDYAKPKSWMLYFRLWDAVVDWSLTKGFTSIHSGQTAYRAKIEMGHELIPLVNYVRHRNPLLHGIYARIAGSLDWEKLDEGLALYLKAHPKENVADHTRHVRRSYLSVLQDRWRRSARGR